MASLEYGEEGLENGNAEVYPVVLVQIPMCNEEQERSTNLYTVVMSRGVNYRKQPYLSITIMLICCDEEGLTVGNNLTFP